MIRTILTQSYNPAFPLAWEGLDLESAIDCTPRVYAVSSGNGNDGVSHSFPDYYVRTTDPYLLARAAVVSSFTDEWQDQAADELAEITGEIDFGGIQACLYEPLDRDPPEAGFSCNACGHEWTDSDPEVTCPECGSKDLEISEPEPDSWCDANGAYMLVDVWPLTREEISNLPGGPWDKQVYDGLESCFGSDVLTKATED